MAGSGFTTRKARGVLLALFVTSAAVSSQQIPPKPGPTQNNQTEASWDWNWGELLYGASYTTTLTVNNNCKTPQGVFFYISDPFYEHSERRPNDVKSTKSLRWLMPPIVDGRAQVDVKPGEKLPVSARAMLSIPKPGCHAVPFGTAGSNMPTTCATVVPPGSTDFEVTIVTPPAPDLSSMIFPAGFNPLTFFDEIAGELVVYSKGQPPLCMPNREQYVPSGHVHLDPNPKGKSESGPRCRDWWDKEEKPRGLTRDCTGEIRDLALTYLRTSLLPLAEKNPAAWSWLPTPEQVLRMSIDELIGMKVRSRATMRGRS